MQGDGLIILSYFCIHLKVSIEKYKFYNILNMTKIKCIHTTIQSIWIQMCNKSNLNCNVFTCSSQVSGLVIKISDYTFCYWS